MAITSPVGNQTTPVSPVTSEVKILAKQLRERGAQYGARRLEILSNQYQHFTVDSASDYIRKDEIIDELENQPHKLLSVLRFFRNVFSIAPIVITWLALGLAANAYQSDLSDARYKAKDTYQSFLYLWQGSFHGNHGAVISFSDAAYSDFTVLAILVILIIIIPLLEHWRRDKLHASLGNFDPTIDDFLALVAQDGANSHLAQSDVNKISEAIKEQLKSVLLNYDRVAIETRDMVRDTHDKTSNLLKDTHEKTNEVILDFKKDLALYNDDVRLLTVGLQKMDTNLDNYGQKLNELTDASNKLAGSSNDLALNAKSMAESATLSSQASQGISTQLGALNLTQQEIVQTQKGVVQEFAEAQKQVVQDVTTSQQSVVQQIETSQKEVVKQLTDASDRVADSGKFLRDATNGLDHVASNLEQLTRADFQKMTDGVTQSNQALISEVQRTASEIQRVAGGLSQVDAQLQHTTTALANAAQNLGSTTTKNAPFMGKVVYSSAAVAAIAVIGELVVLILHSH